MCVTQMLDRKVQLKQFHWVCFVFGHFDFYGIYRRILEHIHSSVGAVSLKCVWQTLFVVQMLLGHRR